MHILSAERLQPDEFNIMCASRQRLGSHEPIVLRVHVRRFLSLLDPSWNRAVLQRVLAVPFSPSCLRMVLNLLV